LKKLEVKAFLLLFDQNKLWLYCNSTIVF